MRSAEVHVGAVALDRVTELIHTMANDRVPHPVRVLRQALALNLRDACEVPLLLWRPEHAQALAWSPEVRQLVSVFDIDGLGDAGVQRALDAVALFA